LSFQVQSPGTKFLKIIVGQQNQWVFNLALILPGLPDDLFSKEKSQFG
jgi:hypothetical protein